MVEKDLSFTKILKKIMCFVEACLNWFQKTVPIPFIFLLVTTF